MTHDTQPSTLDPHSTQDTTCEWLGTAGWIIRHGSTTLVSDPYLSRPPGVAPFPKPEQELAEADLLTCTHGHFDHAFDMERVARLSGAEVWAPGVVCERLRQAGLDPERLRENEAGGETQVGDLALEVIPSKHIRFNLPIIAKTLGAAILGRTFWDLVDLGRDWPMGSNSDFLLRAGAHTIYLSGSLGQDPAVLRRYRPDVALLPYNGRSDMPRVARMATDCLRPRLLVFHHWDDFYPHFAPPQDPRECLADLRREFPQSHFRMARIGHPIRLSTYFG
ncbi:MAG: MBL fold metallo-hydrolase [bacterium]